MGDAVSIDILLCRIQGAISLFILWYVYTVPLFVYTCLGRIRTSALYIAINIPCPPLSGDPTQVVNASYRYCRPLDSLRLRSC